MISTISEGDPNNKKRRVIGWSLYASACPLIILTPTTYILISNYCPVLAVISGLALLFITIAFFGLAEGLLVPTACEVLARDLRSPVIYLRPFGVDLHAITDSVNTFHTQSGMEETSIEDILQPLNAIGPLISIADPSAKGIHRIGAYRESIIANDWQTRVSELLEQAELVVLVIGISPGIEWEIKQVRKLVPLNSLLLFMPPLSGSFARSMDWQDHERAAYDEFSKQFRTHFDVKLPPFSRANYFIGFDTNNKILLPSSSDSRDYSNDQETMIAADVHDQLIATLAQMRSGVNLMKYPLYGQFVRRLRLTLAAIIFIASIPVSFFILALLHKHL